jgi:alkaline phosphatase
MYGITGKYFTFPVCFFALFFTLFAQAKEPTNIIFVIGDGMGPSVTSAYRYFSDNPATPAVETTIFDELFVGMARTYPDDDTVITDSAAAATALATGVKTFNGAIGVDVNKQPLETLLEAAKARGYQTAMVSTSTIIHATPASFVAHVNSRQSYVAIADQYVDRRINDQLKVDLLLGGGRKFFVRTDRNLVEEFAATGYQYITDVDQLNTLKALPALGLFADDGMPSALNSVHPLRLAAMTEKSLSLLDGKPFFLLIEASQVDWCAHANDIACAMAEMHDMAAALKLAKAYVDRNANTILVATADHGTGGLSIGAAGQYKWNIAVIKNIKATAVRIAENLVSHSETWQAEWLRMTAIELSAQETQGMQQLMNKAREQAEQNIPARLREVVKNGVITLTLAIINERSHTGWTTNGHTGEDVQIFSYGKGNHKFAGNLNNTDIAKRLFEYLPANNE